MSAKRIDPRSPCKSVFTAPLGRNWARGWANFAAGLDGFCARMNPGLCAVALVLALAVLATLMVRTPYGDLFLLDLQASEAMVGEID